MSGSSWLFIFVTPRFNLFNVTLSPKRVIKLNGPFVWLLGIVYYFCIKTKACESELFSDFNRRYADFCILSLIQTAEPANIV